MFINSDTSSNFCKGNYVPNNIPQSKIVCLNILKNCLIENKFTKRVGKIY